MYRSVPMNETTEPQRRKKMSDLIFVGCIVTGLGISIATNTMPVGLFIGLGIGFVLMALIRYRVTKP